MSGYHGNKEIFFSQNVFPKTFLIELKEKPENIKDQLAMVKTLFEQTSKGELQKLPRRAQG